MRGKVARMLRKEIYGEEYSPRYRKYFRKQEHTRSFIADDRRRAYQKLKKDFQALSQEAKARTHA